MKIHYPSGEKGQLYIPAVNWALLVGCLITVLLFRDSSRMEAAYGLAITITMLMTTTLLTIWLHSRGANAFVCGAFMLIFTVVEGAFFVANLFKFVHGGWYTILMAGLVGFVMIVWRNATRRRDTYIEYRSLEDYAGIIADI